MQVDGSVGRPSSPAPKGRPTLPGPTSQTPLLQAKFVVIRVGGAVAAAADVAAPRLAATSDAVISRALSGDRMTTSPGRRNGRCPQPDAVTAAGRGPSQVPAAPITRAWMGTGGRAMGKSLAFDKTR